jgi:hypothetical protein
MFAPENGGQHGRPTIACHPERREGPHSCNPRLLGHSAIKSVCGKSFSRNGGIRMTTDPLKLRPLFLRVNLGKSVAKLS